MALFVPSIPGGPELIVIPLFIFLVAAIAIMLLQIVKAFGSGPDSTEIRQRVALLEHEIADLEDRIEELESGDGQSRQ